MWWKVVKVKFVVQCPKFCYKFCRDRSSLTPVLPWSKNDPVRTPVYSIWPTAFLTGPIELISVPIDWKMSCGVPFPYIPKRFRASLTRYDPPNSKMAFFRCFWIFGQLKSMQIGKSKMYILKRNRPAFQRYQIYRDWIGLSLILCTSRVRLTCWVYILKPNRPAFQRYQIYRYWTGLRWYWYWAGLRWPVSGAKPGSNCFDPDKFGTKISGIRCSINFTLTTFLQIH